MSVTILMDPGKMRKTAGSLMDAAAKTRGSANALGALSSPPPGVPASVAGRVTGATNRAKGALERQAALIESLANDMKTRAAFAVAADTGGQIAGWTEKVAGLAIGVAQAGKRYEDRQRMTRDMRRQGMGAARVRNEVDRAMAKKHGVNVLSPLRHAELTQEYGHLWGPDGRYLRSRLGPAAGNLARAPLGGAGRGALRDVGGVGGFLRKSPNAPLAMATTGLNTVSTLANPNLTVGQKGEKIATDAASAAVGALPTVAATVMVGTGVGAVVLGGVLVLDVVSGGKVTEFSGKAGKAIVGGVKDAGKAAKDLIGKLPW